MTPFRKLALGATIALAASSAIADSPEQAIKAKLSQLGGKVTIDRITETPVKGVYEVQFSGGQLVYSSADGGYLFRGDMLKVDGNKWTNLTEQARSKALAKLIDAVPREKMVVFSPKGETKSHITVFTDVDCGYCRKLHTEVPELNEMGIEVRYVAFPRGGKQSPAYAVMENVWCAKDPKAAMTKAKKGQKVAKNKCDNPVEEQYKLGLQVGVSGTPALVLADGRLIPGYQPAENLAKLLGVKK
ncbi:DsbC family protein [Spartinivicinus ruber]|uniref:DsbC family protein n=1 Tax=Spartinivicinus ruber TaxID=2683272 RepID=UPI0013D61366|nr:DsbC family protein [Spartinivicinus ruber]